MVCGMYYDLNCFDMMGVMLLLLVYAFDYLDG